MASYYQQYSPTPYSNEKHGYGSWYQNCNCCPYGYHIDLDFVQFCDTIIQQADRTGSIKRRRDRRRQRQSMEVLLGLEPYSAVPNSDKANEKIIEEETSKVVPKPVNQTSLPDDLEEAVSDFERTLKKSKKLSNHNLPDVTAVHDTIRRAPSISSMSSTSGSSMTVLPPSVTDGIVCKDFDNVSIESCGLSPMALQNIREQMALSLERTKELEERVRLIPLLKTQVATLEKEKQQLILQVKDYENSKLNTVNGNYINNCEKAGQVQNDSHANLIKKESFVTRKDFGVMCSVLTRNVGVGHQCPNTKSVSTTTTTTTTNGEIKEGYTDKWYNEKLKFLDSTPQSFHTPKKPILISKETQTPLPIRKTHSSSQTIEKPIIKNSNATQTLPSIKNVCNIGIEAKVFALDASSQASVKCNTVGVSDDKIDDVPCLKCNDKFESHQKSVLNSQINSISLASLAVSRSKSFNLGDDKLNLAQQKSRTIGCQYESFNSHKAVQSEYRTQTKACQKDLKITHKGVQYESSTLSKNTDTKDLDLGKKHVACNTKNTKIELAEIACNTEDTTNTCVKCSKKEDCKKDENAPPSRIPRLQIPTTPVENRKFKRQDTYTKIPASPFEASGLSGLDLSGKHDTELPSSFEKVKQNYNLPEVSTSQNEIASKSEQEAALPLPETEFAQSSRKKVKPSKEMQAAMKVLNDSLQKGQAKNIKHQLKSAVNIIQQEWFKISSLINANPLDVEDYLDCFEDISCDLLQYVVNMVDSSGNTAMHYAVSHGNFDVVSILLDSKVCDINQTNKAGYTSVMLVSLAVCSSTHANVVRRLFQLADVNIRAKQHGQTALMLAVSHGRVDMVQMLIEAGADINIQDEDGSTALMCASEHGHIDIVKYLLSLPDCDSTILDVDGSTALKIAMEAGHRHIGVLLYAHERNLHGAIGPKLKRTKSASGSPKTPSSPLPLRSSHRALSDNRSNK